jgi:hypothetical protein
MKQPPGFHDKSYPTHVCRLHKAIYGLKQAPYAWFQRFSGFLYHYGFLGSKADSSMFVFQSTVGIMVLLLYVDDIILTGSCPSLLQSFIHILSTQFAMKDLGDLHYFLGIEAMRTPQGLHLSQSKYTLALLSRANMLEAKPCSTPVPTISKLSFHDGDPLSNPSSYRQIVGALQYLTMTRPDLTYAVNQACQFMHSPTTTHLQAVKRILRYIKGTIDLGIHLTPCSSLTLHAFSDANWAGCPDDRRSTIGYCIFLGPNLVSWSCKKQPTVARSSAEAEYCALACVGAELTWLRSLLRELHISLHTPCHLYCDNVSATYIVANPVFHARTKHIEIDYHFICDLDFVFYVTNS